MIFSPSAAADSRWKFQVFIMELRRLITYRADFWVNFIGQIFFSLIIAYYLWTSIFEANMTKTMNGFSIESMIFYYLLAPLIFRIQQGQGIGFLSREIYDGSLSKYLLYPIHMYRYKLMTYLSNSFFFLLQLYSILIIYCLFFYNPLIYSFSLLNLCYFTLTVTLASITFFYLFAIVESLAFWFDNIWSLGVILRFTTSFLGGALIPLKFFPEWAQNLIHLTPFPYLIDFPLMTLKGELGFSLFLQKLLITVVWLFVFKFIASIVWRKGQYSYTGVGI